MATTTSAATKRVWADTPFKLLATPRAALNGKPESSASRNATEMALIHNILLRGLNSIYNQCASPLLKFSEDISDFMLFCASFSIVLRSHHATEENVYFPLLESMVSTSAKGVSLQNHNEHETFLPGLAAFDAFAEKFKDGECEEGKVAFDGQELRGIIDDFGPKLETHLHHEVKLLQSLAEDASIDWSTLGKAMAAESKRTADRVREVPFMITNSDITYEGGIHGPRFPPFPWAVQQIFRWVYIPQQKEAWRFASCDDYGVPRGLSLLEGSDDFEAWARKT